MEIEELDGFTPVDVPSLPDDPNLGDFTISGNATLGSLTVIGQSTLSSTLTGITTIGLGVTSSPPNSHLTFELTSNTNLRIKVKGTDGVIRTADVTLA